MPKQLSASSLKHVGEILRRRGDFAFLVAVLLVTCLSVFIFYRTVYLPVYVPKPVPPREPVFNAELYNRVIEALEARDKTLAKELADIPSNPFEERRASEKTAE